MYIISRLVCETSGRITVIRVINMAYMQPRRSNYLYSNSKSHLPWSDLYGIYMKKHYLQARSVRCKKFQCPALHKDKHRYDTLGIRRTHSRLKPRVTKGDVTMRGLMQGNLWLLLTNKTVGTIWRDWSEPPQGRQGPDPRPRLLLVGTHLVLGPELTSRRGEHSVL